MKSVRKWSISGMDICNLGQMALGLGMGWGEDVLPKGNRSLFVGIRLSVTYQEKTMLFKSCGSMSVRTLKVALPGKGTVTLTRHLYTMGRVLHPKFNRTLYS